MMIVLPCRNRTETDDSVNFLQYAKFAKIYEQVLVGYETTTSTTGARATSKGVEDGGFESLFFVSPCFLFYD